MPNDRKCLKCDKIRHFKAVCRTVKTDHTGVADQNESTYCIGAVETGEPPWYHTVDILGRPIRFEIETGADVSVISHDTYKLLTPTPKLVRSNAQLHNPGGYVANQGHFIARSEVKEKNHVVITCRFHNKLNNSTTTSTQRLFLCLSSVKLYVSTVCLYIREENE